MQNAEFFNLFIQELNLPFKTEDVESIESSETEEYTVYITLKTEEGQQPRMFYISCDECTDDEDDD